MRVEYKLIELRFSDNERESVTSIIITTIDRYETSHFLLHV